MKHQLGGRICIVDSMLSSTSVALQPSHVPIVLSQFYIPSEGAGKLFKLVLIINRLNKIQKPVKVNYRAGRI